MARCNRAVIVRKEGVLSKIIGFFIGLVISHSAIPYNTFDLNKILPLSEGDTLAAVITLEGTTQEKRNLLRWLKRIVSIAKGHDTLLSIIKSGNRLTIKHSPAARLSAGRTIAPMTYDLINGTGADVTIIFDALMPDEGAYRVFDRHNAVIEFTAVQNLYHELAHAMHKMQGTWRYFASEEQAIEEENLFRRQLALAQGKVPTQRYDVRGFSVTTFDTH